jgi:pyruvate dehydrogenase E2 component (dihydrolipoamide acetyltransferase)
MAVEVPMPRLSDTMEQGTIARWLKQEGDRFAAGDVIAEIDTDKATMDLQAYDDGVLLKILVGEGESADLGTPIAWIGEEGEAVPEGAGGDGAPQTAPAPPEAEQDDSTEPEAGGGEPEAGVGEPAPSEAGGGEAETATGERAPSQEPEPPPAPEARAAVGDELRASPIARRIAAEAGLDLRELAGKGSGPDGRIVKVDVERALQARGGAARAAEPSAEPTPSPGRPPSAEDETVEATPMLRAVARRMSESKATVPHFYLDAEIDMGRALEMREELNQALADEGEKVSVNDLVVRAAALALIENPKFHRSWHDGSFVLHKSAHVGIAVALDDGLIVPVLRSVEQKSLREIARESRDLVERAREGKLKQSEIEGGTFTVSNLGMFGIPSFSAVVNLPEPGILAVGATVERPVVQDDAVVIRPIMTVTLSVDHRATSGAEGARLLESIRRHLEQPLLLVA